MFEDRRDAGEKLARALGKYQGKKALVLGIPRGGVEVGYNVAKHLNADFSIIISRKLPYPDNPEAGFGAIAEDGSTFIYEAAAVGLSKETIAAIMEEQEKEIRRRITVLRKGGPLPKIAGRTVILIDDGIAMGSTMKAAIALCRKKKAKRIVVAVPVTGKDTAEDIGSIVDEITVLEVPEFFYAVAQAYGNWYDVTDEEVIGIMEKWREETSKTNR